jgi:hypothetical protein
MTPVARQCELKTTPAVLKEAQCATYATLTHTFSLFLTISDWVNQYDNTKFKIQFVLIHNLR